MRVRKIQEVEREIQDCLEERREYYRRANPHKGRGYWSWGDSSYVPKINECTRHLCNLKLELNRSKIKEWERRAGV